jgi:hypothetical protein
MAALVYSAMCAARGATAYDLIAIPTRISFVCCRFTPRGRLRCWALHLVGERAGERVEMKQEAAMAHRYDDDFEERG